MKRVVYFQKGIKLENDGYNNKIIQNNEILEEITDTLVGAKGYIKKITMQINCRHLGTE